MPFSSPNFASRKRSSPVKLESDLRHDSIKVRLPDGFKLDGFPAPAKVEGDYGSFEARWTVRDGEIDGGDFRDSRGGGSSLDFERVGDFFDKVFGVEGAPVVLIRQ